MKVWYVSNYLPGRHAHVGGAEQALLQTARLAEGRSCDVEYVTLPGDHEGSSPGQKVREIRTLETMFRPLKKYIEIAKWYLFQFDPLVYLQLKKALANGKPDVVHFGNFQFLTFAAVIAAKRSGVPVVVSVYDYWCFCPLTTLYDSEGKTCRRIHGPSCTVCLPPTMRFVQKALLRFRDRVFRYFLSKVDRFVVLSESSRGILNDYGIADERITTIRLSTGHETFPAPAAVPGKGYVLFAGWLQRRKGLHVLLDALSLLWKKRDCRAYLVLQGVKWEPEYERMIDEKLNALGDKNIRLFKGQMRRDEVLELVSNASVVVVPEQWENMSPLIVTEAMAMGRTVVASAIGGIPEFIEHGTGGFLFRNDDPVDLANKLEMALEESERSSSMGEAARYRVAEMLNPDRNADALLEEYSLWKKP